MFTCERGRGGGGGAHVCEIAWCVRRGHMLHVWGSHVLPGEGRGGYGGRFHSMPPEPLNNVCLQQNPPCQN